VTHGAGKATGSSQVLVMEITAKSSWAALQSEHP